MSTQEILDYLWEVENYSLYEIQLTLKCRKVTKKQVSDAITAYIFDYKNWNLYVASKIK